MKKDVQKKMFPRMAHHIIACLLNWLVTSVNQRIKPGFTRMSTLPLSLFVFVSFTLPPCLFDITHHARAWGNRG